VVFAGEAPLLLPPLLTLLLLMLRQILARQRARLR
jgi:hypothetical protein